MKNALEIEKRKKKGTMPSNVIPIPGSELRKEMTHRPCQKKKKKKLEEKGSTNLPRLVKMGSRVQEKGSYSLGRRKTEGWREVNRWETPLTKKLQHTGEKSMALMRKKKGREGMN